MCLETDIPFLLWGYTSDTSSYVVLSSMIHSTHLFSPLRRLILPGFQIAQLPCVLSSLIGLGKAIILLFTQFFLTDRWKHILFCFLYPRSKQNSRFFFSLLNFVCTIIKYTCRENENGGSDFKTQDSECLKIHRILTLEGIY